MNYSLILLAAGKGSRTHLDYNKVFYELEPGKTVLDFSLDLFGQDPDCQEILLVCAPAEKEEMEKRFASSKVRIIEGGETRQDSVSHGLQAAAGDYVFIHDGARPYVKPAQIEALKKTLETEDAALLAVPSVDTVKILNEKGYVEDTPQRALVYCAQTPQVFKTSLIRQAHEKARLVQYQGTDDAQLVEVFTETPIKVVLGDPGNLKITNPQDLPSKNR